jgi:hypothetical protein
VAGPRSFSAASASAKSRSMSIDSAGCVKVGIWYLRALCVGTLSAFVEQGAGAPGVAGASQAFLLNELL